MVIAAQTKLTKFEKINTAGPLDILGQVSATIGIGGLVFMLIEAPHRGWNNPLVLMAVLLMLFGSCLFVFSENRAKCPLLPNIIYRNVIFLVSTSQGALFNFMFYGLLFALSFKLQIGFGLSPIASGLCFLPMTVGVMLGNLWYSRLAVRYGRIRVLFLGQIFLLLSLAAVLFVNYFLSPLWTTLILLIPTGISSGLLVPVMTSQTLSTVPSTFHGSASAAFNTSRQIGGAVGVAFFGPLLGVLTDLSFGFLVCITLAFFAILLSLLLTFILTKSASRS